MLYPVRVMLVAHKNYHQVENRSQTDRVPIPRQYAAYGLRRCRWPLLRYAARLTRVAADDTTVENGKSTTYIVLLSPLFWTPQ